MKKINKMIMYAMVAFLFTALLVINIRVGLNTSNVAATPIVSVKTSVDEAYANACSELLGCEQSNIYCGSIIVDPKDDTSYTITCKGGHGNKE